jgi:hypothetical protein
MARSARHGRREGIHRRSSLGKDSPRVQWEVGPQKNGAGENVTQQFGRLTGREKPSQVKVVTLRVVLTLNLRNYAMTWESRDFEYLFSGILRCSCMKDDSVA